MSINIGDIVVFRGSYYQAQVVISSAPASFPNASFNLYTGNPISLLKVSTYIGDDVVAHKLDYTIINNSINLSLSGANTIVLPKGSYKIDIQVGYLGTATNQPIAIRHSQTDSTNITQLAILNDTIYSTTYAVVSPSVAKNNTCTIYCTATVDAAQFTLTSTGTIVLFSEVTII